MSTPQLREFSFCDSYNGPVLFVFLLDYTLKDTGICEVTTDLFNRDLAP